MELEECEERFKKVESYHVEVPKEHQKYINPKAESELFPSRYQKEQTDTDYLVDHGRSGPLHVSYADPWEKGVADVFVAAEEVGLGTNPDVNSGNPIGMGMGRWMYVQRLPYHGICIPRGCSI